MSKSSLDSVLPSFADALASMRPEVLKSLRPPATDEELDALLTAYRSHGAKLDALHTDLVTLLRWHNGQNTRGLGVPLDTLFSGPRFAGSFMDCCRPPTSAGI